MRIWNKSTHNICMDTPIFLLIEWDILQIVKCNFHYYPIRFWLVFLIKKILYNCEHEKNIEKPRLQFWIQLMSLMRSRRSAQLFNEMWHISSRGKQRCELFTCIEKCRNSIRKEHFYKRTLSSTNLPLHFCRIDHCWNLQDDVGQLYNRHGKGRPIKSPILTCTVSTVSIH